MSDFSVSRLSPVRDAYGPVTCAVCGCRLTSAVGRDDGAYRHFPSLMAGQDARGCRPGCIDALHDRDGGALMPAGSIEGPTATDAAAA